MCVCVYIIAWVAYGRLNQTFCLVNANVLFECNSYAPFPPLPLPPPPPPHFECTSTNKFMNVTAGGRVESGGEWEVKGLKEGAGPLAAASLWPRTGRQRCHVGRGGESKPADGVRCQQQQRAPSFEQLRRLESSIFFISDRRPTW